MFGIEVAFYFLGFVTCLLLIFIITEVNEKDKKNRKEIKRQYRTQLEEQELENERTLNKIKDEIEIDVKVW